MYIMKTIQTLIRRIFYCNLKKKYYAGVRLVCIKLNDSLALHLYKMIYPIFHLRTNMDKHGTVPRLLLQTRAVKLGNDGV